MKTDMQTSLIRTLENADNILLLTQSQQTNDGIASMLAMQALLSRAGKHVISVAPTKVPQNHQFLMGADLVRDNLVGEGDFVISISTKKGQVDHVKYVTKDDAVDILISAKAGDFDPKDVAFRTSGGRYDAVVVLGTQSLEQLEDLFVSNTDIFADSLIINIDTNISNEYYGKINFVSPKSASVSEMVYDMMTQSELFGPYMDAAVATMLLAGVIGHTESFLSKNTTAHSLETAAKLQEKGADHTGIVQHLFKMKTYPTLKLWAKVFQNLEQNTHMGYVTSRITKSDFELTGATYENIEELSDIILKHVQDTDISLLFIETPDNTVRVQVRSTKPNTPWIKIQEALDKEGKRKRYGLDFVFEGERLSAIETRVFDVLTEIQGTHALVETQKDSDTSFTKSNKVISKNKLFPMMQTFSADSYKTQIATAPDHIPFDAPQIKKPAKIEITPETKAPTKLTGIPEFLKKKED